MQKLQTEICNFVCDISVAYPGILVRGRVGSTNSVQDRENGDMGVVAP